MIGQDLGQAEVLALMPAAAQTATGNATGIDVSKYEGLLAIVLDSAAGTGTTPTMDLKVQRADTLGGSYTDVPGAAFAQVINAASRQKLMINVDETGPFIRIARTIGGTTPSFTCSVVALAVPKYG